MLLRRRLLHTFLYSLFRNCFRSNQTAKLFYRLFYDIYYLKVKCLQYIFDQDSRKI